MLMGPQQENIPGQDLVVQNLGSVSPFRKKAGFRGRPQPLPPRLAAELASGGL